VSFDNDQSSTSSNNVVSADNVIHSSKTDTHSHADNASSDYSLLLSTAISREVKIHSKDLNIGVFGTTIIDPYDLVLTQSFIADKIANYNGLRAGLKLTFRVNATPFHFGAVFISYLPFHKRKRTGYIDTSEIFQTSLQLSSSSNFVMLPLTGSSSAEMVIPYIYPRDFIALKGEFTGVTTRETAADTFANIGSLAIHTVVPLQNASTGTNSVTLYTTASLVDPVLALPTTQSGNEASSGPISSVASSVAKYASYAEHFRAIRPFARATREVASHLGGIARVFGFSRPESLEPPRPMRPEWFGNLSSTDQNEVVQKLATDSQCELAVSPDCVRLDVGDELMIRSLCARPTYLDFLPYLIPSTVAGATDYWIPVTPEFFLASASATPPTLAMPPFAMVSNMFSRWRGKMVYTFKAVKSGVHTGRLQIKHDALTSTAGTASSISEVKTTFWNLGDSDEIEICVPWLQGSEFLPLIQGRSSITGRGSFVSTSPSADIGVNGHLQISVVSDLVCSTNSTAEIHILVFARLEDAEFMGPSDDFSNYCSVPATQSGCEPAQQDMTGCGTLCNSAIYGGEQVVSTRALIKRYTQYFTRFVDNPASKQLYRLNFPRHPREPGLSADGSGYDSVGLGTNNSTVTPFCALNWLSRCFALSRGSVRYKVAKTTLDAMLFSVQRRNESRPTLSTQNTLTAVSTSSHSYGLATNLQNGFGGTLGMVNGFPQGEFAVPHYNHNYAYINHKNDVRGIPLDGSDMDYWRLNVAASQNADLNLVSYVAAGSDFSMFYFVCVPLVQSIVTLDPSV